MEREIAGSGILLECGLGDAGILRSNEVLFEERITERFYEWDA